MRRSKAIKKKRHLRKKNEGKIKPKGIKAKHNQLLEDFTELI